MTVFVTEHKPLFESAAAEIEYAVKEMREEGYELTPGDDAQATVECRADRAWLKVNKALVAYMEWSICPGSVDNGPHPYSEHDFGGEVHGISDTRYCTECINEAALRCCRECAYDG